MKTFYRLLARLPLNVLYLLSDLSYYFLYYLLGLRKKVVVDNLTHAFPDKTPAQITELSKQFYQFSCDNLFEVFKSMAMSGQDLKERVHFINPEIFQSCIEQQQSMLLLTIHQSNWEWMLLAFSAKFPFPIDVVYKPLHNQALDELIKTSRQTHGAGLIDMKKAGREILRKRREFRAFVLAADQSPSGKEAKYWQTFFNRPAPFYLGPQKIAEMVEYPVFYVKMHRVKRGYYEVSFEKIAEPPYDKDSFDILSRYIKAAEQAIIEQPETFLWANRKWKRKPETSKNNVNLPDSQ
jgi:KDO2-lipid IV(A) lauroyltransferase